MLFEFLKQDDGYALYEAAGPRTERDCSSHVYFLAPASPSPAPSVSVTKAWAQGGNWAMLIAAQALPATPTALATECGLAGLPAPGRVLLVWWSGNGPQALPLDPNGANPSRQVANDTPLAMYNWTLTFSGGSLCWLDDAGDGAHLAFDTAGASQMQLGRADMSTLNLPIHNAVLLLETADGIPPVGTLCTEVSWNIASVFQLGQDISQQYLPHVFAPEVRYFLGDSSGAAEQYRYPLFDRIATDTLLDLRLAVALNPALPDRADATFFKVRDPSDEVLQAFTIRSLAGHDGQVLNLAPYVDGESSCDLGFYPAPCWTSDAGTQAYYLAPTGLFQLRANGAARLMPGLSALEWLTLEDGDLIEWCPGHPAYGLQPAQRAARSRLERPAPQLTGLMTTSWFRLRYSSGWRAYYARPYASVFYSRPEPIALPCAINAGLAQLDVTAVPCPLAPYGAVFEAGVNEQPGAAEDLSLFEQRILAVARGKALANKGRLLNCSAGIPCKRLATINPTPGSPGEQPDGVDETPDPPVASMRQFALADGRYGAADATGLAGLLSLAVSLFADLGGGKGTAAT